MAGPMRYTARGLAPQTELCMNALLECDCSVREICAAVLAQVTSVLVPTCSYRRFAVLHGSVELGTVILGGQYHSASKLPCFQHSTGNCIELVAVALHNESWQQRLEHNQATVRKLRSGKESNHKQQTSFNVCILQRNMHRWLKFRLHKISSS
jgi:hypothetical protein